MTSTVGGPAILSALIAGYKIVDNIPESSTFETKTPTTAMAPMRGQTKMVSLDDADMTDASASRLLEIAKRALQKCFCEGRTTITNRELQECADCRHTTCVQCGGNPQHNYRPSQALSKGRSSPQDAEADVRSLLPLQIKFRPSQRLFDNLKSQSQGVAGFKKYPGLVEAALSDPFSIQTFRRAHCISGRYGSALGTSHLELLLDDASAKWCLYVESSAKLSVNDPLRLVL